jgi:hypothetical protein
MPEKNDAAEKDALRFCKDFAIERDWCFKHGIDYRELDDERKF